MNNYNFYSTLFIVPLNRAVAIKRELQILSFLWKEREPACEECKTSTKSIFSQIPYVCIQVS